MDRDGISGKTAIVMAALSLVVLGCGDEPRPGATAPPVPPDDSNFELRTEPYTLNPGEEKYFCYAMNLPETGDAAIVKLTPQYGKGTHHIIFAETLAPEPEGFAECPILFKTTWLPLYIGGVESGPLQLPESSGFQFKGNQQVLIQLHLQNTTSTPISDTTAMKLKLVDRSQLTTRAGIFGLDNRKLNIPANTVSAPNEMSCSPQRDMDVFAVLGQMHKHGRRLTLTRAPGELLYDQAWNFDEQPVTALTLSIRSSDSLHFRCMHDNPSAQPIAYGESSDQEMCALLFFYTPFESLSGCIQ